MRIILMGKAGAGRHTVASYLRTKHKFAEYSFAGILDDLARQVCAPDLPDSQEWPRFLRTLDVRLRKLDPDCLTDYLMSQVFQQDHSDVVIVDGQAPRDIARCREAFGFVSVHVTCAEQVRLARLVAKQGLALCQSGDRTRNDCGADHAIDNSKSFDELYRAVDRLVQDLRAVE
ncbi:hypothetical protein ACP3TJ_02420 [Desulforudis sp. 1088]|uniref:hypothetical protein n=1 Tax=unclassified Candidatus Desulforudis TaxID=2635950 RepID=UPI003CE4BD96